MTFAEKHTPWNKGLKTGLAPWRGKKRGVSPLRQPDIDKNCYTCGKHFVVRPTARNQKACSMACRKSAHHGEDNCNWKGGVTPENKKERRRFQTTIQQSIFKRDNYTCQICFSNTSGELHVDHILKWSEHPELRFVQSNLRTLCSDCHYYITFKREKPVENKWGAPLKHKSKGKLT